MGLLGIGLGCCLLCGCGGTGVVCLVLVVISHRSAVSELVCSSHGAGADVKDFLSVVLIPRQKKYALRKRKR